MNRSLVTGANGFIGRNLCIELEKRGRMCKKAVRRMPNHLHGSSDVVSIGSIDENTDWTVAVDGCDTVFHTAGLAHVTIRDKNKALMQFRKVNRDGVVQLARQASAAGAKRFIFLSSIGVYGDLGKKQFVSESTKCAPFLPYALSKREAEIALLDEFQSSQMECIIIRPPLVYGPDCPGNFRRLTELVAMGIPLPLGSIYSRRTMIGITNLIDFMICAAEHDEPAAGIYNIADVESIDLQELLRLIGRGLGRQVILARFPEWLLRPVLRLIGKGDACEKLCASVLINSSLARDTFNWKQPECAVEGIKQAASTFRRVRH